MKKLFLGLVCVALLPLLAGCPNGSSPFGPPALTGTWKWTEVKQAEDANYQKVSIMFGEVKDGVGSFKYSETSVAETKEKDTYVLEGTYSTRGVFGNDQPGLDWAQGEIRVNVTKITYATGTTTESVSPSANEAFLRGFYQIDSFGDLNLAWDETGFNKPAPGVSIGDGALQNTIQVYVKE